MNTNKNEEINVKNNVFKKNILYYIEKNNITKSGFASDCGINYKIFKEFLDSDYCILARKSITKISEYTSFTKEELFSPFFTTIYNDETIRCFAKNFRELTDFKFDNIASFVNIWETFKLIPEIIIGWLLGKEIPPAQHLYRLSNYFNIPAAHLLETPNDKNYRLLSILKNVKDQDIDEITNFAFYFSDIYSDVFV